MKLTVAIAALCLSSSQGLKLNGGARHKNQQMEYNWLTDKVEPLDSEKIILVDITQNAKANQKDSRPEDQDVIQNNEEENDDIASARPGNSQKVQLDYSDPTTGPCLIPEYNILKAGNPHTQQLVQLPYNQDKETGEAEEDETKFGMASLDPGSEPAYVPEDKIIKSGNTEDNFQFNNDKKSKKVLNGRAKVMKRFQPIQHRIDMDKLTDPQTGFANIDPNSEPVVLNQINDDMDDLNLDLSLPREVNHETDNAKDLVLHHHIKVFRGFDR